MTTPNGDKIIGRKEILNQKVKGDKEEADPTLC
jgi:hypothetical protein